RVYAAADQRVKAVGERAADVAPVPAEVDDAREEGAERDEAEPPELRVPELRPPELQACLSPPLCARHAPWFVGARANPSEDRDGHPVVRRRRVGEQLSPAPAGRALEDEQLPERVGLGRADARGEARTVGRPSE